MTIAAPNAVDLWVVFVSFVTASVGATIGPIPLGLGTFEAGCMAMLRLLGVFFETALAATLMLRGLTFWLPMLEFIAPAIRVYAPDECANYFADAGCVPIARNPL